MYCHESFQLYDELVSFLNNNNIQKENIISISKDGSYINLIYIA